MKRAFGVANSPLTRSSNLTAPRLSSLLLSPSRSRTLPFTCTGGNWMAIASLLAAGSSACHFHGEFALQIGANLLFFGVTLWSAYPLSCYKFHAPSDLLLLLAISRKVLLAMRSLNEFHFHQCGPPICLSSLAVYLIVLLKVQFGKGRIRFLSLATTCVPGRQPLCWRPNSDEMKLNYFFWL